MGVIRSLVVNLAANTASFNASMNKSAGVLKGFSSLASSVGSSLKGQFAALAGGIAVGGGLATAAQHLQDVGREAERLGVSAESLSQLAYAGKQADVEFETLAAGMKIFQRNLGDAAMGSGQAGNALELLGVNLKELQGKTASEQLGIVSDALNQVTDPTERASLGMDIFGKQYQTLAGLIAGGSEGIRQGAEELDRLGGTVTREQAAALGAFETATKQLTTAMGGLFQKIVTELAPALTQMAALVTNLIAQYGAKVASITKLVGWVVAYGVALKTVNSIWTSGIALFGQIVGWIGQMVSWIKALTVATKGQTIAQTILQVVSAGWAGIAKAALLAASAAAAVLAVDSLMNSALAESNKEAADLANNLGKIGDGANEAAKGMANAKTQAEKLKESQDILNKLKEKAENFGMSESAIEIRKMIDNGADPEQVNQAQQYADQLAAMEEAAKKQESLSDLWKNAKDEHAKLVHSEEELVLLKAQELGANDVQLNKLREQLQLNKEIKEEKERQKEAERELKKAAEEQAREQEAFQKKITETELDNNPFAKLQNRYVELQEMLKGGLSQGSYDKELEKALEEYRTAGTGGKQQDAQVLSRGMGLEYYKGDTNQQSNSDLLRQIRDAIIKGNGVGTLSMAG
jgi:hypothetical protein